ncbi:ras protein [Stereum hirsutum FP-91666 SS1]|uniref:ras protein n=1 Tax=Stereum hirsutum (strain FP-91666) TaxID=721885 RepID=UPI000440F530|nr:ras protein [Stereum hirsutum FP-91666 SS1]EIM89176.1 ras protein [Stereum hirsutum FP-91666 SS1]
MSGPAPDSWIIGLLGDRGVGKSAIATQFVLDHNIEERDDTKRLFIDYQMCDIRIIDPRWEKEPLRPSHRCFQESHGFLLIYSVTSRSSFDGIDAHHSQLLQNYSFKPHRHGLKEKPVFLLVGNKSDKTDQREVSREEGIAKAKKLGCEFSETSAKTAMNLERTFQVLVRQLRVKGQTGVFPTQTRKAKRHVHCVVV